METILQFNLCFFAGNDISNLIARQLYTAQKKSQEHNETQQAPKSISQSVKLNN